MTNKIGIIGVGAIGSVIAKALLVNDQNLLKFYTRTSKTEIKIEYNSKLEIHPIKCESTPYSNDKLDWVIICLKAHQITAASSLLEVLIGENTKVAVIRNGINLVVDLLPFSSPEYILPCIIDCPVQPKENDIYWQIKHPIITTKTSSLANDFSNLFRSTDITINQVEDFNTEIWKKLIESSALGSILCLTGQTCHIFTDPKILDIYKQLVKEGIEVALADGAHIEVDFEEQLILKLKKYPADKGSSMLTDRILGKRIEIEAKNGAIAKMAKKYNIAAPLNDLFCTLLEKINRPD